MSVATLEEIEMYSSMPTRIAHAIEGLTEAQLHYRPTDEEWDIHNVVIHLADSEAVGFWRIRKTLAEKDSVLAVYDEDAWSKALFYRQQDASLALRLFTDLRTSTAALLKLIPDEDWELTSIHAERGKISIYDILQQYMRHGENHLQQIEHIKQALSA